MSTPILFDQERTALGRLQQLVKDRSTAEQEIASAYQAVTLDADREVQRARRLISNARKKATEELDSDHRAALADIAGRFEAAKTDADRRRHDTRKKTVDQFSQALAKLRAEFEDKLWTVDSLLEAGEKEALAKHQELKRKVDASRKRVEAGWETVEPTLARVRLNREMVTFDADRLPAPIKTDPIGKVQKCLEESDGASDRLLRAPALRALGTAGTLVLVLGPTALAAGTTFPFLDLPLAVVLTLVGFVIGVTLRILGGIVARRQVRDRGQAFGVFQAEAERAVRTLDEHADHSYAIQRSEILTRHANNKKKTEEYYQPRIAQTERQLAATLEKIDTEHARKIGEISKARQEDSNAEHDRYDQAERQTTERYDTELANAEKLFQDRVATAQSTRDSQWNAMAQAWQQGIGEVSQSAQEMIAQGEKHFPAWPQVLSSERELSTEVPGGIRYGDFQVRLADLPNGISEDERLRPAEPIDTVVPAYIPFPDRAAVVIKARDEARTTAVSALQVMMLRFLTGLPPGKVRFTIIDPVGLGENFASFMHLADYDEKLVSARIWTEPGHIEQRLTDLTEHMENVIQKYLRNQYKSIEHYNQAAGEVAEPYRVLVIANFPTNFTPDAARRLVSIMSSGPACGVCTLVSVDLRAALPRDFRLSDLEQVGYTLAATESGSFAPVEPAFQPFPLTLEKPPAADAIAAIVRRVGQASKEAARVEVPFEYIAPPPSQVWTSSAAKGFDVPIGRAGATRRQQFLLGRGTAQHALVAGKTGSGKSTLLHALITNLALHYSPDEAELYLIDFKEGVEFKPYAVHQLPHARVVAIQSEREFGLSVLQRLDAILRERGDLFRTAEVNDLAAYRDHLRQARPDQPAICPRILLIVDEFQNFFTEDDKISQEAALLLDRLVRQGRAFGIHVLLGSQTLGGAYSIPRATIDQMAVRIALQCSEADAQLILSKDNTAARLLNRPGEAIYNDANGRIEGNDPFQVVWLSDELREEHLIALHQRAGGKSYPPPLVFEGSTSADLGKNRALQTLIDRANENAVVTSAVTYLGDPVAIKDPTVAVFRPQSGANLLMLGQHEEAALGLMTSTLVSLASQFRPVAGTRIVTVLDGTPDDSDYADYLRNATHALGLSSAMVDRVDLGTAMADLAGELDRRQKGESTDRSPRFLVIHGLHRFRELRKPEDDFGFGRKGEKTVSAGEHLANILRDGPPLGIHVIAWCDSLTNLQRALDRQALREFTLRVLFQMSPSDSSHLIDSPAASRLGRNRALYIEEGTERPEKFRPYGIPTGSWLRDIGDRLTRAAESAPVA